jgi:hypothetical protein
MRYYMPVIIALLCVACRDTPSSPSGSQPPVSQPPAGSVLSTTGQVSDTANLPISGAEVQLLTGPSAGTMVLTEPNGSFSIRWTAAAGTATLRASKEGFPASEKQVSKSTTYLRFDLQALGTPVVIAGIYDLTLTAANECTQLPNVARQRSHRVRVDPADVGVFIGEVLDGDFPYSDYFSARVRLETPRTLRVDLSSEYYSEGLVERIGPEMLLEIIGTIDLPLGAQNAVAAFEGSFELCAAPASANQITHRCPIQPLTCRSANHRLAWTRQ